MADIAGMTKKEQHITRQAIIDAKIAKIESFSPHALGFVVCHITLLSGFVVTGESHCVDEEDGHGLAYTNALNKLWELEAYLEYETRKPAGVVPS